MINTVAVCYRNINILIQESVFAKYKYNIVTGSGNIYIPTNIHTYIHIHVYKIFHV